MLTLLVSDFGFGPSRLAHADNRATDSPIGDSSRSADQSPCTAVDLIHWGDVIRRTRRDGNADALALAFEAGHP
jgi:hypothetical protein